MNVKVKKTNNINEIKNHVIVETLPSNFNLFRKVLSFSECFFEKTFTGPLVILIT